MTESTTCTPLRVNSNVVSSRCAEPQKLALDQCHTAFEIRQLDSQVRSAACHLAEVRTLERNTESISVLVGRRRFRDHDDGASCFLRSLRLLPRSLAPLPCKGSAGDNDNCSHYQDVAFQSRARFWW